MADLTPSIMQPMTTQNISPRHEVERREEWERERWQRYAHATEPVPYTPRTGETIRREHAQGGGWPPGGTVYVPGAGEDRADLPPETSVTAERYGTLMGVQRAQSGGLEDEPDDVPSIEGGTPFRNLRST